MACSTAADSTTPAREPRHTTTRHPHMKSGNQQLYTCVYLPLPSCCCSVQSCYGMHTAAASTTHARELRHTATRHPHVNSGTRQPDIAHLCVPPAQLLLLSGAALPAAPLQHAQPLLPSCQGSGGSKQAAVQTAGHLRIVQQQQQLR
jgi:hypothetical protein